MSILCRTFLFFEKMESAESDTGMLFAAQIKSMESRLHYEIEQVLFTDEPIECWTYPLIEPKLLEEAKKRNAI